MLDNYQTFIKIGKYVEKIDKNLTNTMNVQKNYSILLRDLRKDVEEFTVDYVKYLKDAQVHKEEKIVNSNNEFSSDNLDFNFSDDIDYFKDFNIEDFLNPEKGTRRWIEEQSEKLKVLIDEKNFKKAVSLVLDIRVSQLSDIDYDIKLELDSVYSYLIEKLTISISVNI